MQAIKITIITFIITLLTACGGGSNSGSDVRTGQFKDEAVKGLKYKTATQGGVTDIRGTYKYLDNEIVTFSLGDLELGSAIGAEVLYPKDIVAEHITNKASHTIKIGQVLQSLDRNKYPDDGIDVTGRTIDKIDLATADLQDLINDATGTETTVVSEVDAKKHIDRTVFNDDALRNNPTKNLDFEDISTLVTNAAKITITNDRLELQPQSNDSIWLLAKKPDKTITEISANITHETYGSVYKGYSSVLLILELTHNGIVDYFSMGAKSTVSQCPDGIACTYVVAETSTIVLYYLGQILSCNDSKYVYVKDGTLAPYFPSQTMPLVSNKIAYLEQSYELNKRFSVKLDKTKKRITLEHGNNSGYFDISNTYFGDLSAATARFFINVNRSGIYENQPAPTTAFIDNVKINGSDFDNFSDATLNLERWDTGKFVNTNSRIESDFSKSICPQQ